MTTPLSLPHGEDPWGDPDLESLEAAASRWLTGAEPANEHEAEMFALWAAEARDGSTS